MGPVGLNVKAAILNEEDVAGIPASAGRHGEADEFDGEAADLDDEADDCDGEAGECDGEAGNSDGSADQLDFVSVDHNVPPSSRVVSQPAAMSFPPSWELVPANHNASAILAKLPPRGDT